jgi:hypothetical protein
VRVSTFAGLVLAVWLIYSADSAFAQSPAGDANIQGTVKDASASSVAGAIVTLETVASTAQRTAVTDQTGAFGFSALDPGNYKLTIEAFGFAVWTSPNVAVGPGNNPPLQPAVLQVAGMFSSMNVTLPKQELAAEQVKAEEKQRLLGVFPDFFVSYEPNAAPLTAAQKFQLGWRTVLDPVTFLSTGVAAGIQEARGNYPEFGQGTEGYAKRFGAQYADHVSSIIIGHVVMQSIFHQDPRYFYKGTGSIRSRALYAIGTTFVRKGDSGHWQPDYSDVLGGMAATELSSLYYPATSRPVRRLLDDALFGFGGRAIHNLLHEFVLREITTHVPKTAGLRQRILPEGTPVSLISVEDWSSKTTGGAGPIAFLVASDVQLDGAIVAPLGSKAWGRANFANGPGSDDATTHVGLERVILKVGATDVPLRSTRLRDASGTLEYHRVENSGRVAMVLYVAKDVPLPAAP